METQLKKQVIYFDESGNTGNDLLNEDQPFFTYSAVAINKEEAEKLVSDLKTKYGLKGKELKYAKLKKHSKGQQVIKEVLETLKTNSAVACFNKQYALCAKFYEYIIEPCISNNNWMFYKASFHHYITNTLYNIYFQGNSPSDLLIDFGRFMKNSNKVVAAEEFLNKYTYIPSEINMESFEDLLKVFMTQNRATILSELNNVSGDTDVNKYTMDLTVTSLFALCLEMSNRYDAINVICDKSKILKDQESMINSITKNKFTFENINYLSNRKQETLNVEDSDLDAVSNQCYGVQLADIMAGLVSDTFKNNDKKLLKFLLENRILTNIVTPEIHRNGLIENLDIIYAVVFFLMVENSFKNRPIVDNEIVRHLYILSNICETYQQYTMGA